MTRNALRILLAGSLAFAAVACSDDSEDRSTTSETTESPSSASSGGELTGLDAAFGDGGVLASPLSTGDDDRFITVAPGPDGSYFASGFTATGGDHALAVAHFDKDGSLDTDFGADGIASVNVAEGGKAVEVARGLVVQPDGKVVIAGPFEHDVAATGDAAKETDVAVVRLDSEGALDSTFGVGGIAKVDLGAGRAINADTYLTDNSWGAVGLPGGEVVVFGSTPAAAADRTDADFVLYGLTANGTPDSSFGTGGRLTVDLNSSGDNARNLKVQDDGKLIATGYSRDGDGVVSPVLIRASADGVLDPTFGTGGVANAKVLPGVAESYQVDFQGDDYVLTGYGRGADSAEKVDMIVYRFSADGTWDSTFGTDGITRVDLAKEDDRGRNLTVLPDRRILVVGSGKQTAADVDGMVALFTEDGAPDTGFGTNGYVLSDLGGPADAWFGVTLAEDGSAATIVGYKGTDDTSGGNDDAAIARISW